MIDTTTTHTTYDAPIVVAGATGKQGGAVAARLIERGHKVRALTRNPQKPNAKALALAGAEVVEADLEDRSSLDRALAGAAAVFSVQDFLEAGIEAEVRQGLNLTEAAAAARVEHVVYSGASTMDRNTGVPHLDSKWQIEQKVRSLDIPWTVFRPASFMETWAWEQATILAEDRAGTRATRGVGRADCCARRRRAHPRGSCGGLLTCPGPRTSIPANRLGYLSRDTG